MQISWCVLMCAAGRILCWLNAMLHVIQRTVFKKKKKKEKLWKFKLVALWSSIMVLFNAILLSKVTRPLWLLSAKVNGSDHCAEQLGRIQKKSCHSREFFSFFCCQLSFLVRSVSPAAIICCLIHTVVLSNCLRAILSFLQNKVFSMLQLRASLTAFFQFMFWVLGAAISLTSG